MPEPAVAQWVRVARTNELTVLMDTARVDEPDTGIVEAWVRWNYTALQPLPGTEQSYRYSMTRMQMDCDKLLFRFARIIHYAEDRTSLSDVEPPGESDWVNARIEPNNERVVTESCKLLGKKRQDH